MYPITLIFSIILLLFIPVSDTCGMETNASASVDLSAQLGYCSDYYDSVLCWPKTPVNTVASLCCPEEIFGITHVTKYNVTRVCQENGTWSRANYSGCSPYISVSIEHVNNISEWHLMSMYYLYWTGYSSSLFFLLIALAIFLHYKSLWCLRNIIHTNLIACFTLHNSVWVIYAIVAHEILTKRLHKQTMEYCIIPAMIIKYFTVAGFFWMFVEGIFLFISIMFSLHTNRIRFWMCALFGWGVPLVLVSLTTIFYSSKTDSALQCWMEQYQMSYIYTIPILIVLCANVIFLTVIMYVVFNRLQITVNLEAVKYKKAIKALLILSPLLGVNYFVVISQIPTDAIWIRICGLLVATFFCFRNNEVRNCIKKSMCRWTRRSKKRPSTGSTYKESIKSDTHDMELAVHLVSKQGFLNSPKRTPLIHNGSYPTCSTDNRQQQIMGNTCNSHSKKLTSTDFLSLGSKSSTSYAKLNQPQQQQRHQNIVVVGALDKGGKMKMRKFDSMLPPAGGKKSAAKRAATKYPKIFNNDNDNCSLWASSRHSLDRSTFDRSSNQQTAV